MMAPVASTRASYLVRQKQQQQQQQQQQLKKENSIKQIALLNENPTPVCKVKKVIGRHSNSNITESNHNSGSSLLLKLPLNSGSTIHDIDNYYNKSFNGYDNDCIEIDCFGGGMTSRTNTHTGTTRTVTTPTKSRSSDNDDTNTVSMLQVPLFSPIKITRQKSNKGKRLLHRFVPRSKSLDGFYFIATTIEQDNTSKTPTNTTSTIPNTSNTTMDVQPSKSARVIRQGSKSNLHSIHDTTTTNTNTNTHCNKFFIRQRSSKKIIKSVRFDETLNTYIPMYCKNYRSINNIWLSSDEIKQIHHSIYTTIQQYRECKEKEQCNSKKRQPKTNKQKLRNIQQQHQLQEQLHTHDDNFIDTKSIQKPSTTTSRTTSITSTSAIRPRSRSISIVDSDEEDNDTTNDVYETIKKLYLDKNDYNNSMDTLGSSSNFHESSRNNSCKLLSTLNDSIEPNDTSFASTADEETYSIELELDNKYDTIRGLERLIQSSEQSDVWTRRLKSYRSGVIVLSSLRKKNHTNQHKLLSKIVQSNNNELLTSDNPLLQFMSKYTIPDRQIALSYGTNDWYCVQQIYYPPNNKNPNQYSKYSCNSYTTTNSNNRSSCSTGMTWPMNLSSSSLNMSDDFLTVVDDTYSNQSLCLSPNNNSSSSLVPTTTTNTVRKIPSSPRYINEQTLRLLQLQLKNDDDHCHPQAFLVPSPTTVTRRTRTCTEDMNSTKNRNGITINDNNDDDNTENNNNVDVAFEEQFQQQYKQNHSIFSIIPTTTTTTKLKSATRTTNNKDSSTIPTGATTTTGSTVSSSVSLSSASSLSLRRTKSGTSSGDLRRLRGVQIEL